RSRSGGISALRRHPGRAAQLQDPRHLHPPLAARRQAGLSVAHTQSMATARGRGAARTGASADWRLARRLSAAQPANRAAGANERGMIAVPKSAMVLAAGLGTRLRPISDTIPKPLVEIGGRALLDHAIDRLALVGVDWVVVNVHYKADMVTARLAERRQPHIEISREDDPLATGGWGAQAVPARAR